VLESNAVFAVGLQGIEQNRAKKMLEAAQRRFEKFV
jgi:hypothetical protein